MKLDYRKVVLFTAYFSPYPSMIHPGNHRRISLLSIDSDDIACDTVNDSIKLDQSFI